MKRITALLLVALASVGIGWAVYQTATPAEQQPLSKFVPAGSMLYFEAKDFSELLSTWNASPEKKQWIESTSYQVFSRSRLFLRLKAAGDQFGVAAGLPPDMDFLTQVSGDHSALALYDIGKLQFLFITHLPSARSMQSGLWQTRAKFEPRSAGNVTFYFRRDPESQREIAFAVSGDYLLLATREDLMAGALQLMAKAQDRSVESEHWWSQATAGSPESGDLRMVLNLQKIVPDGYFRTYWVQQNITDLSHYSAAVSDLFFTGKQYREERTLIRKAELESLPSAEATAAAADLVRLVPENAGFYKATASPSADACFELLNTKLLAPHLGPAPASEIAPQVQLTPREAGSGADLETRIDEAPVEHRSATEKSALQTLLEKAPLTAVLQVDSTSRDKAGVFVRIHSAVVLASASDWNDSDIHSAVAALVRPSLTASGLGMSWSAKSGYQQLDGLWPLVIAVRGKYLLLSNDPAMAETMLANFSRKSNSEPADLFAGFNHDRERANFARLTEVVDRPNSVASTDQEAGSAPQFFSGTVGSISRSWSSLNAENIVIRGDKSKVRQTVTYEWSR